jgi:hypothetical protein
MAAPEPTSGEFLHHLLSLNHALLATRNASLGIDVESGMLVLARTVPMDSLDASKFESFFGTTVTLADTLRNSINEKLKTIGSGTPASSPAAPDAAENRLKL